MSSAAVFPVSCLTCLARHAGLCEPLRDDELSVVDKYRTSRHSFHKGHHIYHEGDVPEEVYSLTDGWVLIYHLMADGHRQILEVLLPGAFFGFQPDLRAPITHSAVCLTAASACSFSRVRIQELFQEHPEVGLRMIRMCARDRVLLHEHIANLGRRTARERIGHFLLQLYQRVFDRQGQNALVTLPLGQQDVSDVLGLSHVHTNRILQAFKAEGLIETGRGAIRIRNGRDLAEALGIQAATG
ncbi:MAG: Crp/Fnr family transcriptional regulator [Methyloligellaceae bacterium]